MAHHSSIESMLCESLIEMLLAAEYCLNFRKDPEIWGTSGCYGFPAALLLLLIADSIGSYIESSKVNNHFNILNNKDYYGQSLNKEEINIIYKKYRNLLTHNTVIATNCSLSIGNPDEPILTNQDSMYSLNLVPFYHLSCTAVGNFLNNLENLKNNNTVQNILKK